MDGMKLFTLLLLPILSVLPAQADTTEELKSLRAEVRAIERKIREAVPNLEERDPELAKLQRESLDAWKAYEKAIDDHPKFQIFKTESKAATDSLTAAVSKGDAAGKEAAKQEMIAIGNRRSAAAMEEPDLKPQRDAASQASAVWMERKKHVLATLPETKDHAAELEKLNAKIQELRKRS